jgi:hypothetical protein
MQTNRLAAHTIVWMGTAVSCADSWRILAGIQW